MWRKFGQRIYNNITMNDLRIVNLSTYTTPDIVEKSNKEWVSYGSYNNYFKYLHIFTVRYNKSKDLY